MLHYILQVVAFQLVFLIIYDVFLRKETFFNLNRAYLLITALLSVGIPFIKIKQIKAVVSKDFVIRLPEVIIGDTTEAVSTIDPQIAMQAGINLEPEPVSIWNIILVSGMCIALVLLLFKISKLVWLAQQHPRQWKGNLLIIELLNSTKAFSFFHYIFLGEKLNAQEKQSILEHEIIHVNQKHTLDLLFFEVFRIVFWFNPVVYMYQNRIATLHEYIADAKAVKRNNKRDYYNSLLSQVFETEQFSFVNPFFKQSLIKKRILMLSKSKSKHIQMLKYALLIPMVFSMLIYTSSYAQEKQTSSTSETLNQDLNDEDLKKKLYDEIVEMKTNGKTHGEIADFVLEGEDKYIMTREEYYRLEMFIKYMTDKSRETKLENGELIKVKTEPESKATTQKTYTEYLKWKKTDEAKVAWENAMRDGILRFVADDSGNLTEAEEKEFNTKLDLVEKDDSYKGLLITSVHGNSKMIIHNVKSNGESKTMTSEETKIIDTSVEVPFATVDEVPIFAICDTFTTQEERKQCMTENIAKHVNKNFNTDLATQLGLVGRQRINVIFKIDKDGFVTGAKARAPHPKLEEEAVRVINTLPQFIPGKHKGAPVTVPYSLPILFQIQAEKINDNQDAIPLTSVDDVKQVLRDNEISKIQDPKEVPFMRVDEVPMYESCVGLTSQKDKKACISKDISMFVNKNFNLKLAKELNLVGRQNISILFKIDELGYVKGVKARATHPDLEKEAMRVIKALPQFIPGKHDGKPVTVLYSLPISFLDASSTNQDKKN